MCPNHADGKHNCGPRDCQRIVEKKVLVEAEVTINPKVFVIENETQIDCCEPSKTSHLKKRIHPGSCPDRFIVQQELCLKIPLCFTAEVDAKTIGVACNDHKHCGCSSSLLNGKKHKKNDSHSLFDI